ncbi:MAG: 30S ribosomal protein S9, partial [Patescibacteria group bacterium]
MAETAQKKTKEIKAPERFWEGIGRRKTSSARARISKGKGNGFVVNGKELGQYFLDTEDQRIVQQALQAVSASFDVSIFVRGGGIHSQAEAVRHGLARALSKFDETLRPQLSALGFLKRDPRMRERQKFGL